MKIQAEVEAEDVVITAVLTVMIGEAKAVADEVVVETVMVVVVAKTRVEPSKILAILGRQAVTCLSSTFQMIGQTMTCTSTSLRTETSSVPR
jgi:hypothetical protein